MEKVLKAEHLQLIYKKVEEEIKKQFSHLPEEIRLKKRELERLETRIHRFIEFIAGARGTPSIAAALEDAESKAEPLKTEIESLEKTQGEAFEPPPKEWIVHRIGNIQEVLERKTEKSALLLRDLTGKIVLTPAVPDVGRPYYRAKSKLKSFAVLNGAKGSNSLQWWTRLGSNQRLRHCQRRALPTELRAHFHITQYIHPEVAKEKGVPLFSGASFPPADENGPSQAGHNGHIGNVENIGVEGVGSHIHEIHHKAETDTIDQVSGPPAKIQE